MNMDCRDTLAALTDILKGKEPRLSSSDFYELKTLKLINPVKRTGTAGSMNIEITNLRNELTRLRARKENLKTKIRDLELYHSSMTPRKLYRKNSEYKSNKIDLYNLDKKERQVRTKLVNKVQRVSHQRYFTEVNDEPVTLSYRGYELIEELQQRLKRVERMELTEFVSELEAIKTHFQQRAVKAHLILKKISPKLKDVDEIHLRSASVGLSGRPGDYVTAVKCFITAYKALDRNFLERSANVMLAESLTLISKDLGELESLLKKALDNISVLKDASHPRDEQLRAISIIMSQKTDPENLIRQTKKIAIKYCWKSLSAAAFLATQTKHKTHRHSWFKTHPDSIEIKPGDAMAKVFLKFNEELFRIEENGTENYMAAALMTSAEFPFEELMQRFNRVKDMLTKFNLDSPIVPSAMLAILPVEVGESMDNLRLASAAISANKLSLGGIENISLGMKLLMQSATTPVTKHTFAKAPIVPVTSTTAAIPSVLAITGLSAASALTMNVGVLTFHEITLHKTAVDDYHFHPVHSHYIYG
jgi:hypothetical protein